MKRINQYWYDSKIYSCCYVLYSISACIFILIIQMVHKTNYDNSNLALAVHIAVPLFIVGALIYSLSTNKFKTNWLISLALLFCFVAELLGSLDVFGNVAVFIGCHICLIIYFLKIKSFHKSDLYKIIPILLFFLGYVLFCFLWLIPKQSDVDLIFKLAVPIYGLLLCIMLWRAICTYKKTQWLLYSVAATLFFLSDLNVLMEGIVGFGEPDPIGLFTFTWITYPISITLISIFNRNTLHFVNLLTVV